MREHADDFSEARRRRPRVPRAHRRRHRQRLAARWSCEGLWQQRRGKLWARIETYFHTQKMRDGVLLDHTAIIDALEQRDADARARGDAPASRARRARVSAAMGRDRPGRSEQERRAPHRRRAQTQRHHAVRNLTKEEQHHETATDPHRRGAGGGRRSACRRRPRNSARPTSIPRTIRR